jgi:hypothetical protein
MIFTFAKPTEASPHLIEDEYLQTLDTSGLVEHLVLEDPLQWGIPA